MNFLNKLIDIFATGKTVMFAENKILITGLGNVGFEYANTRHNAGFLCVEALAKKHNQQFTDGKFGFTATVRVKNKTLILLKPSTYMNLSGKAIYHYLNREKISQENLLVISDDIALPFKQVRIRKKGGAGGHNGLQHIIDYLGTSEFARIRVGIGNQFVKGYQSDYVLGDWDETEVPLLTRIAGHVVAACEMFALSGVDLTMNQYNRKEILFDE
jgi:peptidyl-tRNA hydrolase, PTH1 family